MALDENGRFKTPGILYLAPAFVILVSLVGFLGLVFLGWDAPVGH